jgi:hypothetical protein
LVIGEVYKIDQGQAKRLDVKVGSAAQIKKAYDDGLSVRAAVATFTTK